MREVKFRVYYPWAKESGLTEMVYFDLDNRPYQQTKEPNILMQYTGLKDKNGNEIYEGDIVQQMMPPGYDGPLSMVKESVEWDEESACFNPFNYGDYSYDKECEIIGNICQHSHLMEVAHG